jgi:hypothetical protein
VVAGVLASLATAAETQAKTSHQSRYTYKQTYGTALRLVKVDLGLEVTDHDPDWGYLMFEYISRQGSKRTSPGSFEFVRANGSVQVSLQIPAMASHHERVIIDRLKRKLSDEHGTPPRAKPEKKPEKAKDEPDDAKKRKATSQPKKTASK